MILCIGEILADMIERKSKEEKMFCAFCGGAPFNVAVSAKRAGASVGFIGRVGEDPIGRFLQAQAAKADLTYTEIQTDSQRDTTLAFVALKNGERDFAFHRHDTADYHIDTQNISFDEPTLSIVHLGSLMLSETEGQLVAQIIVDQTRAAGKKLSFDVNLRNKLIPRRSPNPFVRRLFRVVLKVVQQMAHDSPFFCDKSIRFMHGTLSFALGL